MKKVIRMTVNGKPVEVAVEPNQALVDVLRDDLGLTGTKVGCGEGDCGSCSVLLEGAPVTSCLVLAMEAEGKKVLTIEGMAGDELHPVQQAFIENGAVQCGFCTPGMVISAKGLLDNNPHPEEAEIKTAISGNLCRCTGYQKIVDAIRQAGARGSG